MRLELTLGALHRVRGAVQPVNHSHHLAEPAAADVDVVGAKSRHCRQVRGGEDRILAAHATVRRDLRGLLVVVQEGVAVARRGFGRLEGHAGPRRRARGWHSERALAFAAVGVGVAPRRALEKVALAQRRLALRPITRVPALRHGRGVHAEGALGSELRRVGLRRRRVVPEPRALVPSRGEVRGRPHAEVLLLVRVVDARELRLLRGDEVRSAEALRAEALRARDLLRHRAGAAAVAARNVPALALACVGKLRRGTARGLHRHVGQALREGRHPGAGQHRPLLQPEIQREVAHVALPVSAPPSSDVARRRGERAGPINLEGCQQQTTCRVFF